MSNTVCIRLALLSLALGWTAFAGLMAGSTPLWPSAFLGSLAALFSFFTLAEWVEVKTKEPDSPKQRITLEINGERYGVSDE
jgi:4-hydroxybenzoate polyprenyltransferase